MRWYFKVEGKHVLYCIRKNGKRIIHVFFIKQKSNKIDTRLSLAFNALVIYFRIVSLLVASHIITDFKNARHQVHTAELFAEMVFWITVISRRETTHEFWIMNAFAYVLKDGLCRYKAAFKTVIHFDSQLDIANANHIIWYPFHRVFIQRALNAQYWKLKWID